MFLSRLDFAIGEIPETIGLCSKLKIFDASDNKLEGELRRGTKVAASLSPVDFATGKIPDSIGDCKELKELVLVENNLEGDLRRG